VILNSFKSVLSISILIIAVSSCKKDDVPPDSEEIETYGLDTTLYPGDWATFSRPDFTPDPSPNRNVLLENFEGHRCPNSVNGDYMAKQLAAQFPGRVLPVTIHAGPTGLTAFQDTDGDCGTALNPLGMYCDTLFCNEGLAIGDYFGNQSLGFFGIPQGTVNRKYQGTSNIFFFPSDWETYCEDEITANQLDLNIQAQSDYFPISGGVYVYAQVNMINQLSNSNLNMVGYFVENEHQSWQDSLNVDVPDYEHYNVLRACMNSEAFGATFSGNYAPGDTYNFNYSFSLPAGASPDDYHLLLYVYDPSSYEVYQVIRHDLN
jgi:hypothetical protein